MTQTQNRLRNAQGCGTVRQRADGRWEARFTIGRNPATGKQIQKSVYASTKKEASMKLREVLASIDSNTYREPSKISLKEWLEIWLNEYISNIKPLSISSYNTLVKHHIIPALGAVPLANLDTPVIQKFYNSLRCGEKSLAPKTIKNLHGVLHRALEQAVRLHYISVNPSSACILPRIEKRKIVSLDDNDIVALLAEIKGHKYEMLYYVDLFTGMRQGEILGLTWNCVNFENGTILIEKQLQKEKRKGGQYVFVSLKNSKTRIITPAPSILDKLYEHKIQQNEVLALNGIKLIDNDNLVFSNEFGKHLVHTTVYKNFKVIVARLGIPKARFHDLRHSYAVAALQSGDDVKTVQENLGHHSAAFTLDVYGHVTDSMRKKSSMHMEKYINDVLLQQRVE